MPEAPAHTDAPENVVLGAAPPPPPADLPILSSLMQHVRGVDPDQEKEKEEFGPYRVVEIIGEGGMGTVYKAEQRHPVRRVVALKVIKPGMDSKEVIARFAAERQALALMSHPNVARVYDAAVSDTGRPYFAMEYVAGVPLTVYCDENRLTTRERLELFIPVCHAVQHAHQKGIIHRDLKPSNILVTLVDGKPVPKVIDFGIAKATNGSLTERTLFTRTGALVGTPEYMAPEQAVTGALDVDTRADLYSLGVVLYELLTGTLPFDARALDGATPDEMARIVREKEPRKPSTKLGSLSAPRTAAAKGPTDLLRDDPQDAGADKTTPADHRRRLPPTLPEVARRRRCEPRALVRELRGDLDWIVMRCLEKDRTRRYATAHSLAADVKRHLDHEPVAARPPSKVYRLRKLARKHRLGVAAAAAVILALLLGTIGTTVGIVRARQQRAAALEAQKIAEEASDFMTNLLARANPFSDRGLVRAAEGEAAVALLDAAARQLDAGELSDKRVESRVRLTVGAGYMGRGSRALEEKASVQFQRAVRLQRELDPDGRDPHTAKVMLAMASLLQRQGEEQGLRDAESLAREALRVRTNLWGDANAEVADAMDGLSGVLRVAKRNDEAVEWARRSLAVREKLPHDPVRRARTLAELAKALERLDEKEEGIVYLKQAYDLHKASVQGPTLAGTASALADAMERAGHHEQVIPYSMEALAIRRQYFREDSIEVTGAVRRLNRVYTRLNRLDPLQNLLDERQRLLDDLPDANEKAKAELAQQLNAFRRATERANRDQPLP